MKKLKKAKRKITRRKRPAGTMHLAALYPRPDGFGQSNVKNPH